MGDCSRVADVGMDGDRPLQLREVAEMIRKADDSQAVVKGLSLLPSLIEAAPDELANYSSEHCCCNGTKYRIIH